MSPLSGQFRRRRAALLLAALPIAAVALAGCSSSGSSDASSSPSPTPTSSTSASCSPDALLAAVPSGAEMLHYDCAEVGGQEWAALEVNPGNTVFFLEWNGTAWDAMTSDDVCGTASAGVPEELLSYCQTPTPTPTTTQSSSDCTSQALLAALPSGSTMLKYNCADAGGEVWAAAKVNPGNTVFFLKWKGGEWDAMTADSICGTASAGLPQELLDYC